jgi:hypothetical protein
MMATLHTAMAWGPGATRGRRVSQIARSSATRPARGAAFGATSADARRRLRPEDAAFAATVRQLLALPLDAFAGAGQMFQIRVPWDAEPLWFVPTPEDAKQILVAEGVNPGRIWTANALRQLLAAGFTRESVRRIAQTRIAFEAEDVVISPPRPTAAPSPTHEQLTLEAL